MLVNGRPVPVNPRISGLVPDTAALRRARAAGNRQPPSWRAFFQDWNWFPALFALSLLAGALGQCRAGLPPS